MGRVTNITVRNYKSVGAAVHLRFPEGVPLILVGENNAGKSNIIRGLDLVLGESWPGTYEPEDHDYHLRNKDNIPIEIAVHVEGVIHEDRRLPHGVECFILCYPPPPNGKSFYMVYDDGANNPYVSNETREQCLCILVGADRRLSYQMSYASKYTFLSKLMHRFHKALTADPDRVEKLQTTFEEVKSLFQGVPSFSAFTEELQRQVADLSENLEYGLKVDFSAYDPSNPFHALRIYPQQDDRVLTYEELGTGQEQILALSFAQAYAKAFHGEGGLLLAIEEPEAHLHPLARKWVGHKIRELAGQGVQVAVTTHSPAFLDIMGLEGIALLRKENGATQIIQLTREQLAEYCKQHGAAKVSADSILPFYAAGATEEILAGFFARKVVLVEGPTEALALPVYLARTGLDVTKSGIAVIPVHGVTNLAKWWRLFSAYSIPVYIVFDNDAQRDPDMRRRADLLTTLAVPPADHENLLKKTSVVVGKGYAVLGNNCEDALRSLFEPAYAVLEDKARQELGVPAGQSKPLVARYVAQHMPYDEEAMGWKMFKALTRKLIGLKARV